MTTTEQERESTLSLDDLQTKIDEIYARHTARVIEQANELASEIEPVMIAISGMPRDQQHSALAIVQLREARFGREVEEACNS